MTRKLQFVRKPTYLYLLTHPLQGVFFYATINNESMKESHETFSGLF